MFNVINSLFSTVKENKLGLILNFYTFILCRVIIIIYLSWSWAICWPVWVSYIQKLLHETCQWLKFPLNGLRTQIRVSPVVGLPPLASGPACLGMAFPPFLVKQLYCCDSVISSFVRTGYTTRRWGWLLGRICYSITHHYPLYPLIRETGTGQQVAQFHDRYMMIYKKISLDNSDTPVLFERCIVRKD